MAKAADKSELFRKLPSVDELLNSPELREHAAHAQKLATAAARSAVDRLRREIAAGSLEPHEVDVLVRELPLEAARDIERTTSPTLRRVINASGVVLHTNLGRAPLSEAAIEHLREVVTRYSNLEFDVDKGERGKRDIHVDALFRQVFRDEGADISTIVVNNNAAAVLLALNALAEGGEVVVSRGELVEIGGSFRIPDLMSKSGATLREVGTTNRTRIQDYERAITDRTRLLLRVHRSNFEIVGFTEQPSLEELVALGRKHDVLVMEDLGSGALFDLRTVGIHDEPGVRESLRAGVDVVTYSGDKLLGGPQAGMLSGRREVIARIRSNPLFRALRVDKLTYAVLQQTLVSYAREDYDAIPAVAMMRLDRAAIRERSEVLVRAVSSQRSALTFEIRESESVIGGGAAPGATLPTFVIAIQHASISADELSARLRRNGPPIVTRVEEDRVILDLRTVFADEDELVRKALAEIG
jgi:L-seryl-tRNA(Ser) seleniumtransferase